LKNKEYVNINENPFIKAFFVQSVKNILKIDNEIDTWASFTILKKEMIKHLKIS
jgi:hypothetical protein